MSSYENIWENIGTFNPCQIKAFTIFFSLYTLDVTQSFKLVMNQSFAKSLTYFFNDQLHLIVAEPWGKYYTPEIGWLEKLNEPYF